MYHTPNGSKLTNDPHAMQIFTGVCVRSDRAPVVGRLTFDPTGFADTSAEARIAVCRLSELSALSDHTETVGAALFEEEPTESAPLPPFPCLFRSAIPKNCHGKIALLDPACGTLFVSPDLGTVNRYSSRLAKAPHSSDTGLLRLPDGSTVRLALGAELAEISEDALPKGFALYLQVNRDLTEDDLFELCGDLTEGHAELPITIAVAFDRLSDTHNSFCEQVRGLFRGAVFGNFSLLLGGILTARDLEYAKEQIHRAFCELKNEGREYNGYLRKGILLDTPLLLEEPLLDAHLDFICVDAPRLLSRLTGRKSLDASLYEAAVRRVSPFFRRLSQTGSNSLIWTEATLPPALTAVCADWRIESLILPMESAVRDHTEK